VSHRRKILIVIGIAVCAIISLPIVHHYQLRFALAKYIADVRAKGEPMDLDQVIPPPIPVEQDGVPFISNSLTNLVHRNLIQTNPPPAMGMVAAGRAMIGWQQPDIRNSDATNSWEDLGRELALVKTKLDSFQNLTNHQSLDFHFDYKKGLWIPLGHLYPLRGAAEWLKASVLYDLHERRTSDACAKLRALLAIAKGLSEERFGISQITRNTIVEFGVYATWEILQDQAISENDLARLQQDWETLEFVRPFRCAQILDRVILISGVEHVRETTNVLWQVNGGDEIPNLWFEKQWDWFWSYTDEKRALQIQQVLIDAARMAETNHSYHSVLSFVSARFLKLGIGKPVSEDLIGRMDIDPSETRWLLSEGARGNVWHLRKSVAAETDRSMIMAAIALKRYQLRNQRLPGTLQELIPVFLKVVPIDWMDGEPVRYHLINSKTFRLYSVGQNGDDDGGNPSPENPANGPRLNWNGFYALDWVWPQPATPEEIQKYHADQASRHVNHSTGKKAVH